MSVDDKLDEARRRATRLVLNLLGATALALVAAFLYPRLITHLADASTALP